MKNEKIDISKIPIDMYEVPGQATETETLIRYYNESNEKWLGKIEEAYMNSVEYLALKIQKEDDPEKKERMIIEILSDINERVFNVFNLLDIYNLPENQQDQVYKRLEESIEKGLDFGDLKKLKIFIELIWKLPEDKRPGLRNRIVDTINNILDSGDLEKQKICAEIYSEIIFRFKSNQKTEIYKKTKKIINNGLDSGDLEKQKICARMIRFLPINEYVGFYNKLERIIKDGLNSGNPETEKACAEMIWILPNAEKRFELSKIGLDSGDLEKQKICARICIETIQSSFSADEEKQRILMLTKEKLGNEIIESSLYKRIKKDENGKYLLSKADFEKTGSETTLLGKGLEGKVIIRHITPESFLAWKKAFEDYAMWKQEGFEYVPVEPIIKFRLNNDGLVDVFSGVLDCDLEYWEKIDGNFIEELKREVNNIKNTLKKQEIAHGHDFHDRNFCLKFYRDKDGNVNFSKKPRIYIIDFDRAIIESR